MLRRNYERCLFMGISSIIHIVFGPEHRLKLGASSKCANKLLGLLRKGVADMSPSIKIVQLQLDKKTTTTKNIQKSMIHFVIYFQILEFLLLFLKMQAVFYT